MGASRKNKFEEMLVRNQWVRARVWVTAWAVLSLSGCAAINGVNQLANNLIGATAGTANKALQVLTPPARNAQTQYDAYKAQRAYVKSQQKQTAKTYQHQRSAQSRPVSHREKKHRTSNRNQPWDHGVANR